MNKNNFSEEDYYKKKTEEKKHEREEKKLKDDLAKLDYDKLMGGINKVRPRKRWFGKLVVAFLIIIFLLFLFVFFKSNTWEMNYSMKGGGIDFNTMKHSIHWNRFFDYIINISKEIQRSIFYK
ncbi:MAG: hypothetical protein PVI33_02345 [Candidatus Omnitrophota bacterium]|jgi:hypothetical protein